MPFREGIFRPEDLRKVGSVTPDDPPLRIGDHCELNSGSPVFLVVEAAPANVTLSWRDDAATHEHTLPRACVHRVTPPAAQP